MSLPPHTSSLRSQYSSRAQVLTSGGRSGGVGGGGGGGGGGCGGGGGRGNRRGMHAFVNDIDIINAPRLIDLAARSRHEGGHALEPPRVLAALLVRLQVAACISISLFSVSAWGIKTNCLSSGPSHPPLFLRVSGRSGGGACRATRYSRKPPSMQGGEGEGGRERRACRATRYSRKPPSMPRAARYLTKFSLRLCVFCVSCYASCCMLAGCMLAARGIQGRDERPSTELRP